MQTEGEANPLRFSQVFHLAAMGSSFVITNGMWGSFSAVSFAAWEASNY